MRSTEPGAGRSDLVAVSRAVIDANRYMTLATADGEGRPWASPVWYAHDGYTDFLWVSRPDTLHTRNLLVRPQAGIVIFDSTVPPGGARAVYADALTEELTGTERERGIAVYARRSRASGLREWRAADVTGPAPHRLYRARALRQYVLDGDDRRIPVEPAHAPGGR